MANVLDELQEKYNELRERVEELEDDVKFLRALEAAGVDSWEGYEVAQEMMED